MTYGRKTAKINEQNSLWALFWPGVVDPSKVGYQIQLSVELIGLLELDISLAFVCVMEGVVKYSRLSFWFQS